MKPRIKIPDKCNKMVKWKLVKYKIESNYKSNHDL